MEDLETLPTNALDISYTHQKVYPDKSNTSSAVYPH